MMTQKEVEARAELMHYQLKMMLEGLARKQGLTAVVQAPRCDVRGAFSFTVRFTIPGSMGEEQVRYDRERHLYDLPPLGRTFVAGRKTYRVLGMELGKKHAVLCEEVGAKKVKKFSPIEIASRCRPVSDRREPEYQVTTGRIRSLRGVAFDPNDVHKEEGEQ